MEDALWFNCSPSARSFGFMRQKSIHLKYLHNAWDNRMVLRMAERFLCSLLLLRSWSQFFGGLMGSLCPCFWRSRVYSCMCLWSMGWQCHKDLLVEEAKGCSSCGVGAVHLKSPLPVLVWFVLSNCSYSLIGEIGAKLLFIPWNTVRGGNLCESSPNRQCLASGTVLLLVPWCDASTWTEPTAVYVHRRIIDT